MYGSDNPWLWRGQANSDYGIEPAIHTRIRGVDAPVTDEKVGKYVAKLMETARAARLDHHEGVALPDLALLAMLQHHGAATPLLDVSLDPIVALYMAVVSPNSDDDEKDGVVFAIKRPKAEIAAFDSRTFAEVYATLPTDSVRFYSSPDVSERLRIQRGHFILGKHSDADTRCTIPLSVDARPLANSWIWKRMEKRGNSGTVQPATTDVAAFRVTGKFKTQIRQWLEARSGLTRDFVYPTTWHQPHLDRFAASHGRRSQF
jgi:hypothetical protein